MLVDYIEDLGSSAFGQLELTRHPTQHRLFGWIDDAIAVDQLGCHRECRLLLAKGQLRQSLVDQVLPTLITNLRKQAINRMVELTGLREGVRMGAQTDAVLHQSPAVQRLRAAVGQFGLKEAIRRFQAGELDS